MNRYSLMLVPESGQIRSFTISRGLIAWVACLLVLLVLFGCWGIYSIYQSRHEMLAMQELQLKLDREKQLAGQKILSLKNELVAEKKKVGVYSRTLAQLEARVSRLDALGSRLVDVAALDKSEFDFGLQPAFGGPRVVQASFAGLDSRLNHDLDYLDQRLGQLDAQLAVIEYALQEKRSEAVARPHAWPTEGGWLSSTYGMRADPFTGENERHQGVDIANRFGAPVLAAARGVVTFAGKMKDFGYMVDIDHGYGYRTRYGHMSSLVVKPGDVVEDGQLIGRIGSSGRSTGPHLHYEVHRYGRHINPRPFLPRG